MALWCLTVDLSMESREAVSWAPDILFTTACVVRDPPAEGSGHGLQHDIRKENRDIEMERK